MSPGFFLPIYYNMPSTNATRERPTAERRKTNVNTRNAANKQKAPNNNRNRKANNTRKANAIPVKRTTTFRRCR
jgi:hypothetical protein